MDLNSPTTLLAAWLLVPALVALASAGLGCGLARLAGLELGALTLPAGLLAGIALMSAALQLGAGPEVTVAGCSALALAGAIAAARRPRRRLPRGIGWAAGAAVASIAVGMAPLLGSGHSTVLGYVLNNDSAIHIGLVEALAEHGAEPVSVERDSFHNATQAFEVGYPIGSYTWPLFGRVLTGVDPFHTWSPLIALYLGMLALVAYGVLRMLAAPRPFAAAAGALVAVSYLPLSYAAQGGAKEVLLAVTVLGTLALALRAYEDGITLRSPLPAALAAAAAFANFGATAAAWLVPAAVVLLTAIAWRARRRGRSAELRAAGIYAGAAALLAAPVAIASLSFLGEVRDVVEGPRRAGNLFGPVPVEEALNVWLARDYRLPDPQAQTLTTILLLVAGALAAAGLVHAVRARRLALPLIVGTTAVACLAVYPQVSIYFEAKTLVALAPALGLATAAGTLWLLRSGGAARAAGAVAGAAVALGVVASAAYVYSGVWTAPHERLEELADIGDRFAGRGRILVSDREYYAAHLLHEAGPWDDWSERQPEVGIRGGTQPPLPHTPDFDDYRLEHFGRFRLLLERKAPAASRPPSSFEPAAETEHYRVWRRTGPDPRAHVPLDGGRLDCSSDAVRRLVREARRTGSTIAVSLPGPAPLPGLTPAAWTNFIAAPIPAPPGQLVRRGGRAAGEVALPRGEWVAWLQGSYGPGVRLGGAGEVRDDLGFSSAWHAVGRVRGGRRTRLVLDGIERSAAVPGSHHIEISGPLVLARAGDARRVELVSPAELRSRRCGRPADWLELPALQ